MSISHLKKCCKPEENMHDYTWTSTLLTSQPLQQQKQETSALTSDTLQQLLPSSLSSSALTRSIHALCIGVRVWDNVDTLRMRLANVFRVLNMWSLQGVYSIRGMRITKATQAHAHTPWVRSSAQPNYFKVWKWLTVSKSSHCSEYTHPVSSVSQPMKTVCTFLIINCLPSLLWKSESAVLVMNSTTWKLFF